MITSLRLTNFKAIAKAELSFGRLCVIVGPNGSGKTSVLSALHYLSQIAPSGKHAAELFIGPRAVEILVHGGASGMSIEVDAEFEGDACNLQLRANATPGEDASTETTLTVGGAEYNDPFDATTPEFARKLRSAVLLHLDADRLSQPSIATEEPVRIEYDGTGLATVLADMALSRPTEFDALQNAVRTIIPYIDRIRLERVTVTRLETELVTVGEHTEPRRIRRSLSAFQIVFDVGARQGIPSQSMSEGTMLVVGLLTVLSGKRAPRLLLIDDLDRALHPRAQLELLSQIRKLLVDNPSLQVVATSHSPYLLNGLSYDEIVISSIGKDGVARSAPLSAHPDLQKWKQEMLPGEFWSAVGENWVLNLGGPTASAK
jgi:predicted ATPase